MSYFDSLVRATAVGHSRCRQSLVQLKFPVRVVGFIEAIRELKSGLVNRHAQKGFTLVELLVVLAIVGMLALVGAPALTGTMNDFRQRAAFSLVTSDLNLARAEAIKRNSRILVCARNSAGDDCSTSTTGLSTVWQTGWVVCVDANGDNLCDTATSTSPNPIVVRPALNAALRMVLVDSTSTAISKLQFNANSSQGDIATGSDVTFTVSGTWSGAATRSALIRRTGNITIN